MEFDWDYEKANSNLEKHGVSFDEAKTVFDDPLYIVFADPDHSVGEHRYIIMGSRLGKSCWSSATRTVKTMFV